MKSKAVIFHSFILFVFLVGQVLLKAEEPFAIKEGDKVLFYGDSITDQRLYTTFAESYIVTRFPRMEVTFVHSGWGGDRVSGGGGGPIDLRLQRDVFAYKPSVITIMLGMNDGSYRAFDQGIFDQYAKGYEHILAELKKQLPQLRLTLIIPSPFDDVTQAPRFEGGYNKVLIRYGEFVKELVEKEHAQVADLNTSVVAALEKAKSQDAELSKKIIPDRVHPGPAGHILMAAALLKAWHAPAQVSSVAIDAASKKAIKTEHCTVMNLQGGETLSWEQLDEALPLPIDMSDNTTALAVNSSDVIPALDQEILKLTGLSSARYALHVDGQEIGSWSKEEWAEGVNLATQKTPMLKQAMEVHRLTLHHNNIHFARWRQIQVPMATYQSEKIKNATRDLMAGLDAEEEQAVKEQRAAAQPVRHRFEIKSKI